ncbi:Rossmann-fold NAD(P)-binding domain-containing protein [Myroides indicus]|uniref:N-succinylornithine carbamoyltransferase n=1 Tax=Myroides indicus TaxID=1323422 RepID=A0A4V3E7M0_9FLAO|nr:acetylornithine carbamoyltransferase [Myroides indicus]TDS52162.1 N-succinyl-L-ornithine transcarbamylase [Myroides indicus]
MKQFFSVKDISSISQAVKSALDYKQNPYKDENLGKHKTIGLIFLNPSLRTRMSTQKAALNLGMDILVMNMTSDGWALETKDGVAMTGNTAEHIREAAAVMGEYCEVLGLRSFPKLKEAEEDYSEEFFSKFAAYCGKPIISLESATLHPLQSFTDLITIIESFDYQYNDLNKQYFPFTKKPKVVLTWAPHTKALPQAVPNSFAEWMCQAQAEGLVDFVIAHPEGYALKTEFTIGANITTNQEEALKNADFVYVKNWSSYEDYGKITCTDNSWMITSDKLKGTNNAKVMHCLPVRRDVVIASEVLDSKQSIVIQQAGNRVWAAQAVLKQILTKE